MKKEIEVEQKENNVNNEESIKRKSRNIIVISIILLAVIGCSLFVYFSKEESVKSTDSNKQGEVSEETNKDDSNIDLDNEDDELDEDAEIEVSEDEMLPSVYNKELTEKEGLEVAKYLYDKGIGTWTCGFDLDLEHYIEGPDGYELYLVTNWEKLRQNFTSNAQIFKQIGKDNSYSVDELVVEKDGKYYSEDCGIGTNIYYRETTLKFISHNDETMKFKANSAYCEDDSELPDDNCKTYIKENDFILEYENGRWRISSLVYPQI